MSVNGNKKKHSTRRRQMVTAATVALTMASIGGTYVLTTQNNAVVKAADSQENLTSLTPIKVNDSTSIVLFKNYKNPNSVYKNDLFKKDYPLRVFRAGYARRDASSENEYGEMSNDELSSGVVYKNFAKINGKTVDAVMIVKDQFNRSGGLNGGIGAGKNSTLGAWISDMETKAGDSKRGAYNYQISFFDHQTSKPVKLSFILSTNYHGGDGGYEGGHIDQEAVKGYKFNAGSSIYEPAWSFSTDTLKHIVSQTKGESEDVYNIKFQDISTINFSLGWDVINDSISNPNVKNALYYWTKWQSESANENEKIAQALENKAKTEDNITIKNIEDKRKTINGVNTYLKGPSEYSDYDTMVDSDYINTPWNNYANYAGFMANLYDAEFTVDPNNPRNDITGAGYNDLHKTVTRTVNITDPHTGKHTTTQTVKFKRNAVVDGSNNKVKSYGSWEADGKTSFDKVSVPSVAGYKASRGDIEAKNVSANDGNQTIDITYSANDQSFTIHYKDKSGKELGTQKVLGKTDQTVNIAANVPKGYHLADSNSVPKTYKFKASGNGDLNVTVNANEFTVDPNNPRSDIAGAGYNDLHKSVRRTVNITDPHTGKHTTTQEVKFKRNAVVDSDTKKVKSYGGWVADGKGDFDKVSVPSVAGYTPSRGDVAAKNVSGSDKDETIDITYTANDQQITYNFVDSNGKKVGNQTFKGKTDSTVNLDWKLPDGYHLVDKDKLPKTYKFKASGNNATDVKVSNIIDLTPEDIGRNKYPGIRDSDYHKTVTRTVKITDPHTKETKTTTQTVKFTRTLKYDAVAKKISEYGAWVADGKSTFDKVDVPAVAGYTPTAEAPQVTPKGDGKDSVVDIHYTANTQSFNLIYQDKSGKEVGRHALTGKTDEKVKLGVDAGTTWVPDNYEVVEGTSIPETVTLKGAHTDDMVIKVFKVEKSELEAAIKKGQESQKTDKYENASVEIKHQLDVAISNGQNVDKDTHATQKSVNAATKTIQDAVAALDKSAKKNLEDEIAKGKQSQAGDKYKNGSDKDKKALDDAIKHAEDVAKDPNATQKDINDAQKGIQDAIDQIDKDAKKGLEDEIAKGKKVQAGDKYPSVSDKDKKALDDAISHGETVDKDPNATQKDIDDAAKAIQNAIDQIDKDAKKGLEDEIAKGKQSQAGDKYKNGSDKDKKALDDAVKHAEDVDKNPDATKKDIDAATKGIQDAIDQIDKDAKKGLEDEIAKGKKAQTTDKYQNAPADLQNALNDAIKHGEDLDKDPNATQKDIDEATKAIENAIKGIDAYTKKGLEDSIKKAQDPQTQDKLGNIDDKTKNAFDDALKKAQDVDKDPDATKAQVDEAKKALDDAQQAVDKAAKKNLESAIEKGKKAQKSEKYQDASDAKKKALDDALANAEKVDQDPDASQAAIDNATKELNDASSAIDGLANKDALKKAISDANAAKNTAKYKEATEAGKKNFDDALANAEKTRKDPEASQKAVDKATTDLINAINGLDKAHKTVTIDPSHPVKKGEKIPGTDIVSKGGLEENDLNRTITRTINWTDPSGAKHTEKQTAKFTRTASIDLVTEKVTYGAWSNNGKQILPAFVPKVEGYTVTGSVPAVTVTPESKDITENSVSFTFINKDNGKTTTTENNDGKDSTSNEQGQTTDTNKGQDGKTNDGKSEGSEGVLPKTGRWVMENAKAILLAIGTGIAGLGGWLFKRKKDEAKENR